MKRNLLIVVCRRWTGLAAAALLVLAGLTGQAMAERVALVIGNGSYSTVRSLANPSRDAASMTEGLEALGFVVIPVIDGNQVAMRQALLEFGERAHGAEAALVFYAGHGVQVGGENYLLPVDVSPETDQDLRGQAISATQIREALLDADAETGILILDACRNDPFTTGEWAGRGVTLQPGSAGQIVAEGLARMGGGAGLLIAYATDPGNVAADGEGDHSPFTTALLRHMATPGLDIRLMFGRVRQTVVLDTRGGQTPWVEESLLADFTFAPMAASDRTGNDGGIPDNEASFWQAIADSTNPADFEVYLQNYPEGTFSPLARNRIAAFGTEIGADEISLQTIFENSLADWSAIQRSLFVLGYLPASAMTGESDGPTRRALAAYLRLNGITGSGEGAVGLEVITGLHRRAAEALVYLGGAIGTDLNVDLETLRAIEEAERVALDTWARMRDRVAEMGGSADHPTLVRAQEQIAAIRSARLRVENKLDGLRETYQGLLETAGAYYADLLSGGQDRALAQFAVGGTRIERFARNFVVQATGELNGRGLDSIAWMAEVMDAGAEAQ